MRDTQEDQSSIYRKYFDVVKIFNTANKKYLQDVNEAAYSRKMAIQRAIDYHINPLLSRLRFFQTVSVFVVLISIGLFFGGCGLVANSSTSSKTSGTQGGFGVLLILVSLGLGFLTIVAYSWTSVKIRSLTSKTRESMDIIIDVPNEKG